mmetsp:Transcript_82900/g.239546  ORF Transcript_82900/g.239546 Transcript_82900/m.239546 type:complete len:511 (+) Transcript_82900:575-2107(+)
MRVVEGQCLREVEQLPKAEHLAGDDLLAGSRGELAEETEHRVEAQVTAFGQVEVLAVADGAPLAAQREVHAREDVLGQVQGLRGLRDAALLHHVLLVHDVGVAVVHPGAEHGEAPLADGPESDLRARREVADGTEVAGDVLRQADDALGLAPAARIGAELAQDAGQQQHLLEVGTLVRVDALAKNAPHERDCVVLVVVFAVAEDWEAGELDAELGRSALRPGDQCALPVDEAAVVAALLPLVHLVHIRHLPLLARRIADVLPIDERDLQALGEFVEHLVHLPIPSLAEGLVDLHGDQASEGVARLPHAGLRERAALVALDIVVRLQGGVVQHHAGDGAVQGLHPHRGPHADLIPLCVRVVFPLVPGGPVAPGLHSVREGAELVPIARTQPVDEGHGLTEIDLYLPELDVRLAPRVRSAGVVELLLRQDDGLAVVRDHHGDPGDEGRAVGPRDRQPQAARDREEAPHQVRVVHVVPPAAIVAEEELARRGAPENIWVLVRLLALVEGVLGQ